MHNVKDFYFCINPKSFILLLTNLTCSLENYPNSRSGIEKCVMVDNDWGNQADENARLSWKNYNCETRMEFVCEIPAGYEPPTTAPPPTLPPPIPCNPETMEDGWVKFPLDQGGNDEFCYLFSSVSYMGWLDAQQNCIQQGGRLASIHSTEENAFFMHNLGGNTDVAWIGFLKDAPSGQFLWTDGSPSDFLSWGPGGINILKHNYRTYVCFDIKSQIVH